MSAGAGSSVNRSTFENGRDPPGLCANCGASRMEHLDRTCAEIREETMPGCNREAGAVSSGKSRKLPRGNAAFRKVFERHAHEDDWGVLCVYDYAAWRIWQAAIRYERNRAKR